MSPGSNNRSPVEERRRLLEKGTNLRLRALTLQLIRSFLSDRGYLEVETPHLIPAPAPELHIEAISAGRLFLHTSPELCMKRLLAAGYPRLFQVCRCFREAERGAAHLPEFTMLEWYRAGSDYAFLMEECEELILSICRGLGRDRSLGYQGNRIDLERPWDRITVKEAFERFASLSVEEAVDSGRFDEVMVEKIEPHLGLRKPVFLFDYPTPLAALARARQDAPSFAERFELYIAGLELANAFSELTDPQEQEKRFRKEMDARMRLGRKAYPMPQRFLEALSTMPDSAGIALGVDRLIMLLADVTDIDRVVSFTPEEL